MQDGRQRNGGRGPRAQDGPRRPATGHARKLAAPTPEAQQRRQKIDELMRKGLPQPLAQAVANGQMSANDAVVRLQRDDEADRIARVHDLPRALAMQIAMGHADLTATLRNRRVQAYVDTHGTRSVFDAASPDSAVWWSLGVLGQSTRPVRLLANERYELHVRDEAGVEERVHKTTVKYVFPTDDFKRVRKHLEYDKALRARAAEPQLRPQDRYACSDRRIGGWWDERQPVVLTTVEGEVFSGDIAWFSRYEIALTTRSGAEVVLLRHALADAHEARRE